MDDAHDMAVDKHSLIGERLTVFTAEVTAALNTIPELSGASADPHTQYVQALQTITRIQMLCEQYRDLVSAAAHQEPNPLSINRIADASGLAINTVRAKLPSLKQGRVEHAQPPF